MERNQLPLPPPVTFPQRGPDLPYDSDIDSFLELPSDDEELGIEAVAHDTAEVSGATTNVPYARRHSTTSVLVVADPFFHCWFVALLVASIGLQVSGPHDRTAESIHLISLLLAVVVAIQLAIGVALLKPTKSVQLENDQHHVSWLLRFTRLWIEHMILAVVYSLIAGLFSWENSRLLVVVGNSLGIVHASLACPDWKACGQMICKLSPKYSEHSQSQTESKVAASDKVMRILRDVNRKYNLSPEDEDSLKWIVSVMDNVNVSSHDSMVPALRNIDKETREWILGTYSKARAGSGSGQSEEEDVLNDEWDVPLDKQTANQHESRACTEGMNLSDKFIAPIDDSDTSKIQLTGFKDATRSNQDPSSNGEESSTKFDDNMHRSIANYKNKVSTNSLNVGQYSATSLSNVEQSILTEWDMLHVHSLKAGAGFHGSDKSTVGNGQMSTTETEMHNSEQVTQTSNEDEEVDLAESATEQVSSRRNKGDRRNSASKDSRRNSTSKGSRRNSTSKGSRRNSANKSMRRNSGAKQLVSTPRTHGKHRTMDYLTLSNELSQLDLQRGQSLGTIAMVPEWSSPSGIASNQHNNEVAPSPSSSHPIKSVFEQLPTFTMPPLSLDETHQSDGTGTRSPHGRTFTGAFAGIDFKLLKEVLEASCNSNDDHKPSEVPVDPERAVKANQLAKLNETMDSWEFDVFQLEEQFPHNPLSFVLCSTLMKNDIYALFSVKESVAAAFATGIESSYISTNPYHNALHAADVLQTLHHFTTHNQLRQTITNLDLFGALVAAAIHDMGHPGTNNAFLIATASELALTYNDHSVLENMHVAKAFELMREGSGKRDIFSGLGASQRAQVRELVIGMVLATDMSHHFNTLEDFRNQIRTVLHGDLNKDLGSSNNLHTITPQVSSQSVLHIHERKVSAGGDTALGRVLGDTCRSQASSIDETEKWHVQAVPAIPHHSRVKSSPSYFPTVTFIQRVGGNDSVQSQPSHSRTSSISGVPSTVPKLLFRQTVLKMALHCADVSNPAKPLALCKRWADRVLNEFFIQGDKERELGLPVSRFMDRTKPALPKMQLAFISVIVQPLLQSLTEFLPQLDASITHNLAANVAYWESIQTDSQEKEKDVDTSAPTTPQSSLIRATSRSSTGKTRRLSLSIGQKLFWNSPNRSKAVNGKDQKL